MSTSTSCSRADTGAFDIGVWTTLKALKVDELSPLEALTTLCELKRMAEE